MAGEGERFKKGGHVIPKPLIDVAGTPMVARALRSLPKADLNLLIMRKDQINLIEFINLCGKICLIAPTTINKKKILKHKDIDFASQRRHFDFFDAWPEFDMVCSNSLVKKELKIKFTSLRESLLKTYSWLIEDMKRLNNFSLRGERYILYNLSVPFYLKCVWKIIDFIKAPINKFKQCLIRINFVRNTYHHFKNIAFKRTKL